MSRREERVLKGVGRGHVYGEDALTSPCSISSCRLEHYFFWGDCWSGKSSVIVRDFFMFH